MGQFGGFAASVTVGGTASAIGGGKFWDGAKTAAYGYLFNAVYLACRGVVGIANHCGVFVTSSEDPVNSNIKKQFSLSYGHNTFDSNLGVYTKTSTDDFLALRGRIPGSVYLISPPSDMASTDFEASVIARGNSYSAYTYRPVSGPNSNTAAAQIIYNSGGKMPDDMVWAPAKDWGHSVGH
ncbi:MAG: hypothetical protein Q7T44_13755 [Parvibaculum sp.]|nr:hypothetical protein [Parvibaculum sp.]